MGEQSARSAMGRNVAVGIPVISHGTRLPENLMCSRGRMMPVTNAMRRGGGYHAGVRKRKGNRQANRVGHRENPPTIHPIQNADHPVTSCCRSCGNLHSLFYSFVSPPISPFSPLPTPPPFYPFPSYILPVIANRRAVHPPLPSSTAIPKGRAIP